MSIKLNGSPIDLGPLSPAGDRLGPYRKKRYGLLRETGLPGKKTEHWMKFDISDLMERDFGTTEQRADCFPEQSKGELDRFCVKAEIVNGFLRADPEKKEFLEEQYGIRTELSNGLSGLPDQSPGLAGDEKGRFFYDLNSAMLTDPVYVRIKKTEEKRLPLYLPQIAAGGKDTVIINPRIVIVLERGAELDLVQSFESLGDSPSFANPVTEILLEEGAVLNHLILQNDSDRSSVFNNLYVSQGRESRYNCQTLVSGASLSRNEYHISLKGQKSESRTEVLYLGSADRKHNSDITVYHEAPQCRSRTGARAIAGGDSQGVFRGFAVIGKNAPKSDAVQQFKSILLNDSAQMNMEPHLEIWTDDVKCSHGATVGQLDKDQLFYLQSRGFTPEEARRILLETFASAISESIPSETLKIFVKEKIIDLTDRLYE